MAPSFRKNKIRIKYVGDVRKSKLITTNGVGALTEFPGFSGIMGGLDLWDKRFDESMKIHEKRLERILHKEFFIQPSSEKKDWKSLERRSYAVPIIRFPRYYYCPQCNELDFVEKIAKNYKSDKINVEPLKCNRCDNVELIASRFVVACKNGHIDDFPYQWWTHKKKKSICDKPRLKIEYISKSSGLDNIKLYCETCGASNTMAHCLSEEALENLECRGNMPWLKSKCDCDKKIRALMRGATNIYYPEVLSALTIPPWSNNIQRYIEQGTNYDLYDNILNKMGLEKTIALSAISQKFKTDHISDLLHCSEKDFISQILKVFDTDSKSEYDEKDITVDEYKAFIGEDKDDIYFKTNTVSVDSTLAKIIIKVKQVNRLREVQVLKGFKRISTAIEENSQTAPLSKEYTKWLPAVELLGEGIFIEFNKDFLMDWSKKFSGRYEKMRKRYNAQKLYLMYNNTFSPEFVFLHTFSHLLMKELSWNCGYDASSIKEKIFSSTDENWMSGILIYTSSSSSDGSLGGLSRQGLSKRLRMTIERMLNKAEWCSNDPVCIQAEAQGNNSLNYAACYACTLVPEVSCVNNNILLDRYGLIEGTKAIRNE